MAGTTERSVPVGPPQLALSGRWRKVVPACSGLDEAAELIQLPWLLRKLMKRPTELQLKVTKDAFIGRVTALRALLRSPWEAMPFSGETATLARRDGRKGTVLLHCKAIEGGVRTEAAWGAPLAGTEVEENTLDSEGRLVSRHVLTVGGRSTEYTTVYKRLA